MSERHACWLLGQWRGTQRYKPVHRLDEDELTQAIIALAANYGRYGYRRITALLRRAGWQVSKDRVQRIWRREGLKVPQKHRPRRRLWLNDGSCIRLRPERRNHVWSYDFVSARTHDGRTLRLLTLLDEYTRECLAIRVVPHPVSWTHICAMPPGVAHTPRAPRSAFDTQASRDARSGCTAPRSRPRRRGRPRGSERFGHGSLAP